MDNENSHTIGKRSPFLAVLLSIAATGLGHLYCGKLEKGLVLFFFSFAFAPIIVTSMESTVSTFSLIAVIVSILILLFVFIYAIIDAGLSAGKTPAEYRLKQYNRWYIYLLFILVSFSYPTNLANAIRANVLEAYKIPSSSMVPNVIKGDHIFLTKPYTKQKRLESVILWCSYTRMTGA